MKRIIKRSISVLLMISLLMASAYPNVASAAKIKLNKTSLTLTKGKSYTLKIKGTSKKVTWKSNKKSVATVNRKGTVTAKKEGKATIVATVSKKKYSCKVSVKAKKETKPTVKPTEEPTETPTAKPAQKPTETPTVKPAQKPTETPTVKPTQKPTETPTVKPAQKPTATLTIEPTIQPTVNPTKKAETAIKCYNVQDTNLDEEAGTGGKGDASIVDCGNRDYVMIDCGSEVDYDHLRKRILKTCDKSYRKEYEGKKVYIPILILSHNHKDHMGAIEKLLGDGEIFVKEVVYTRVGPTANSDMVKNAAGSKLTKLVSKAQYDEADAATKKTYQYKITRNISNTNITVYGPAKKYGKHETDELEANNSSMIVKVEGDLKALFLGDLCYDGLDKAVNTYGIELFSADYDFCKFGHHGYRAGSYCYEDGTLKNGPNSDEEGTFSKEITLYNQNVNAKEYVFTASKKRLLGTCTNDMDIYYNYLCLINSLKYTVSKEHRITPKFNIGFATIGDWNSIGSENESLSDMK